MPNVYDDTFKSPAVFVAGTLAGIRSIKSHSASDNAVCFQIGNAAAYDQAVAIWTYDGDNTTADNGTSILKPSDLGASDPGRWRKP